ncbi:MAG: M24 family metallopeptidase [Candidatus Moraniibacteriota bacterium]
MPKQSRERSNRLAFPWCATLVGHSVGRELHEELPVPNYVSREFSEVVLQKGMTLALEPMVNAGKFAVRLAPDQWTFATADGSLSAHF